MALQKYEKEQPVADGMPYAGEEGAARARQSGLWSDPYPVAPWDFRKRRD